jgi:hypothetical protein
MSSNADFSTDRAGQRLDLEIVDLDQSRNSHEADAGFKSGGSGSCGCGYWIDDGDDVDASTR